MIDSSLGDGLQDCTQAIRDELSMITESRPSSNTFREGGLLKFSSGIYLINKTIHLPSGNGFRMEGAGIATRPPNKGILPRGGPWIAPVYPFLATAFLWGGDPNQPMFTYGGSGAVFNAFSLYGDGSAGSVGLHIKAPSDRNPVKPGLSIGHCNFGAITFANFGAGMKCGVDLLDGNCGDFSFDHLELFRCTKGIEVANQMGMNFAINFCQAYHCETVFDFYAGGKFHCSLLSLAQNETIFRVCRQGNGNGSFTTNHFVFDASHTKFPTIVKTDFYTRDETERYPTCTFNFQHIHVPIALARKPGGEEAFQVEKPSRVIIGSAEFLPKYEWQNVIMTNVLTEPK